MPRLSLLIGSRLDNLPPDHWMDLRWPDTVLILGRPRLLPPLEADLSPCLSDLQISARRIRKSPKLRAFQTSQFSICVAIVEHV